MAASNILLDIQVSYSRMTKTEKKIADYVTANSDKVIFMSISELAESVGVADASVHRFCRTLGMKGYQEFKMLISLSLSEDSNPRIRNTAVAEDDIHHTDKLADELMEGHFNALKETRMFLNREDIRSVVGHMLKARHIYFFGVGDSMLTAQDARNRFLRITHKVSCIEDPHLQAMTASMTTKEDVIFFISFSGATKDNIYVASIARQTGAKLVGITRFIKSPLAEYMDYVLISGSKEGPLEGGSMGVKITQLYIIDILFHEYYKRNHSESVDNNKKTSKAVVEKLF